MKILISIFLFCFSQLLQADSVKIDSKNGQAWQSNVPDVLKPWLKWVLKEEEQDPCINTEHTEKGVLGICNWYLKSSLIIEQNQLQFKQSVKLIKDSYIQLVYADKAWPASVQVNQVSYPVVEKDNQPVVYLEKGDYQLIGVLNWANSPSFIQVPKTSGIIDLVVNNSEYKNTVDADAKIWRGQNAISDNLITSDFLNIQVFRKIIDSVPYKLETVLRINSGGRAREVILNDILLGTEAYELDSALPAYFDDKKNLLLRVKPGQWETRIYSFANSHFDSMALKVNGDNMPSAELWSFSAEPSLRTVSLAGAQSVDPSITEVPAEWRNLPTYSINSDTRLFVERESRADPSLISDQYTLERTVQLLSDGSTYNYSDKIIGKISTDGRLDVGSNIMLGSVTLNGMDQAITKLPDNSNVGIEIRAGDINLKSSARVENDNRELSVTGWLTNFQSADMNLYLPNGYKLLHVTGASTVYGSWLGKWDLLDIFLILASTVLAFKVLGKVASLFVLVGLILVEQQFALAGVSIALLIFSIILKLMSDNWLGSLLKFVKFITVVTLIFSFLPYSYERLIESIYPQLENNYNYFPQYQYNEGHNYQAENVAVEAYSGDMASSAPAASAPVPRSKALTKRATGLVNDMAVGSVSNVNKYLVDPNMVQTGFGEIKNYGKAYQLNWLGPINQADTFKIYYLTPLLNLIWAIFEILLAGYIIWMVAFRNFSFKNMTKTTSTVVPTTASMILVLLGLNVVKVSAQEAKAEFPNQALLQELKQYASQQNKPKKICYNNCALISKANFILNNSSLNITLGINSAADLAQAIFTGVSNLELNSIDSSHEDIIYTKIENELYLRLPEGVHTVEFNFKILGNSANLSFAQSPKAISIDSNGWQIVGADALVVKDLKFEKLNKQVEDRQTEVVENSDAENRIGAKSLSAMATLTRRIVFGNDWSVINTVSLEVPAKNLIQGSVSLLNGEDVITANVEVEGGKVKYQIQPGENSFNWESKLKKQDQLAFEYNSNFIPEVWEFELTNLWHASFEGIPAIVATNTNDNPVRTYVPRNGEKLTIAVSKPEAIVGNTKTINNINIDYQLSEKFYSASAIINIKSSIGQSYSLALPENSKIDRLTINDQDITTFGVKQNVVSVELNPGEQVINVNWQAEKNNTENFTSPNINFNAPIANINTKVTSLQTSWVLWLKGPRAGPVVLLWGYLLIAIIIGLVVAKSGYTPFSIIGAILLILGLSFNDFSSLILIFGFFIAMGWRKKFELNKTTRFRSNLIQIFLFFWGLAAISTLLGTIENGLLGSPAMSIMGNGSYANIFNWYQDVSEGIIQSVEIIAVPVFYFRVLMLIWSLWLAMALIKWGVWVWEALTNGGGWVAKVVAKPNLEAPKSN
jgi:hypothetical protein